MREITIKLTDNRILLGREGEDCVLKIIFDLSEWKNELGDGVPQLILHPRKADPYPVALRKTEQGAEWIVTASDTQFPGKGRAQLTYTLPNGKAKSKVFETYVEKSLDLPEGAVPPPAHQGWVEHVVQVGENARESADRAGASARRSEAAAENSEASATASADSAAEAKRHADTADQSRSEALELKNAVDRAKQQIDETAKQVAGNARKADANAQQTAKDAVKTTADRVQTGKDREQTGRDAVKTTADVKKTGEDAGKTATDRKVVEDTVRKFDSTAKQAVQNVTDEGNEQVKAVGDKTTESLNKISERAMQGVSAVKTEGDKQVARVQAEGGQIQINKESIMKLAVKSQAEGNPIVLKDSAEFPLVEMEIRGSTTQAENPSPEKPQPIINGKMNRISWNGKNLSGIEVNSQATPYESYKGSSEAIEPIELSKWDRIVKQDGVWAVKRNTKHIVLTGNENWILEEAVDHKRLLINAAGIGLKPRGFEEKICNTFPYKPLSFREAIPNIICENNAQVESYVHLIIFTPNFVSNIAEWKQWLTSHPTYFYCESKEPTYEPLPQATQEVLNKIQTFYPNSVIQTNEGITIDLTYIADTKNYIDNKLAEIRTAIIATGGAQNV